MLLRELAVPFDLALVDRKEDAQHSPDYLRLNPHGRIPVLVDGDLVLYEAAAIMLHLADRHPDAGWSPPLGSPRRAQLYKWLIYLTNTLQAEMMLWFYPQRFTDDPNGAPAVKAAMGRRIAAIFAHLADELSDRPRRFPSPTSICSCWPIGATGSPRRRWNCPRSGVSRPGSRCVRRCGRPSPPKASICRRHERRGCIACVGP